MDSETQVGRDGCWPRQSFSSLQSSDDRITKIYISESMWPHQTSSIAEQIHLQTIPSAPWHNLAAGERASMFLIHPPARIQGFWLISALTALAKRERVWAKEVRTSVLRHQQSIPLRYPALARPSRNASHSPRHNGGCRNTTECSQVSSPWDVVLEWGDL